MAIQGSVVLLCCSSILMIPARSTKMAARMGINNLDKILQLIPSLNYADTKRLNNSVREKLDGDTVGKVIAERE
jgi:hypothetical protein